MANQNIDKHKFKLGEKVFASGLYGTFVIVDISYNEDEPEPIYFICNEFNSEYRKFEHELSPYRKEGELYHKSILIEAEQLVHGNRNEDYGHPLDDFTKTAALWSVIANAPITPEQVGLMMCVLKISRQMHKPKRDNLVDLAGYAETVQMCIDEIDRRADEQVSFGDMPNA